MLDPTFHENLETSFNNFKDAFIGTEDLSSILDGKPTTIISCIYAELYVPAPAPVYAGNDELYSGNNVLI